MTPRRYLQILEELPQHRRLYEAEQFAREQPELFIKYYDECVEEKASFKIGFAIMEKARENVIEGPEEVNVE